MRPAILIYKLPPDLSDSCFQQADKYEEYGPTKENIISIVEAQLAMKSPDDMEVNALQWHQWDEKGHNGEHNEDLQALGKGSMHCYKCGGQGHIAAKCATPEPTKGKSKGKGKDEGKGQGGKAK